MIGPTVQHERYTTAIQHPQLQAGVELGDSCKWLQVSLTLKMIGREGSGKARAERQTLQLKCKDTNMLPCILLNLVTREHMTVRNMP